MFEMPLHIEQAYNLASMAEQKAAERKALWAVIFGLVPYLDGDKWCVLYGKDLQTGIAGFGDTPVKAMYAFNDAMYMSHIKCQGCTQNRPIPGMPEVGCGGECP